MPNVSLPSGQDWDPVSVGRSTAGQNKVPKSAAALTRAKDQGLVQTEKKQRRLTRHPDPSMCHSNQERETSIAVHRLTSTPDTTGNKTFTYGGSNASAHTGGMVMSARKLEESDSLKHAKVDKSLSKAIMQARTAKKMTQKDLATAVNEKPQVIAEYESGKAIPNGAIIVKIERKLGCKLPRPGKKPAPSKTSSTGTGTGGAPRVGGRTGTTRGGPAKRRWHFGTCVKYSNTTYAIERPIFVSVRRNFLSHRNTAGDHCLEKSCVGEAL
eukprot:scaffold61840_cov35-Attheya_sp.AAC.1